MKTLISLLNKPLIVGLLFLASYILLVVSFIYEIDIILYFSALLVLITFLLLLFVTIRLTIKKKWWQALLSSFLLFASVIIFAFGSVALFFIEQSTPDNFAAGLEIPENIEIYAPHDLNNGDTTIVHIDFVLLNSFQPGLYEYKVMLRQIEPGIIYLKAYEITQNTPLSVNDLRSATQIRVSNKSDSLIRFERNNHFTIYEGDWGSPYAARFEVWYKSDKDGKEKKIYQRNYKIEGWQR